MALLVMVIDAMDGIWTLEQPSSSLIWKHHRFQQLVRMYQVSRLVLEFEFHSFRRVPTVSGKSVLFKKEDCKGP